jgi:hypothetical protein
MDGCKLQDRLYLGFGLSARHVGRSADAFRPKGPLDPLDKQNRFLRLPAAFVSASGGAGRTNVYGEALWHGIFDASYTRPGDYLVLEKERFFIASQAPLLPLLCVLTNRTISIARPNTQTSAATNGYGGYFSGGSMTLLDGWPASVLVDSRSGSSGVNLPTDQAVSFLSILIPTTEGIIVSDGDLVTDDLGRTAIITGSELTDLGWRLSAKLATT